MLMAIDPGASGGLAVCNCKGENYYCCPFPDTESEIVELIRYCNKYYGTKSACIEKVGGFIGKAQPGSAMFKFGRNVGFLVGVLTSHQIPFYEVPPQTWQKAVGAGTRGERTKTQWKRHLLDLAKKRHPKLNVTLATADAVLMLDYMRMKQ